MKRAAVFALLLFGALVLQVSVFPWFQFLNSIPEVVMVTAILIGMYSGPIPGAAAGFAGGLLQDLFVRAPRVGVAALAFTIAGYAAGAVERSMMRSAPWMVPALAFGLSLAGGALQLVANWITGSDVSAAKILPAAVYTAVIAVPLSPVVRRLCEFAEDSRA